MYRECSLGKKNQPTNYSHDNVGLAFALDLCKRMTDSSNGTDINKTDPDRDAWTQ